MSDETIKCPKCGAENKSTDSFCIECGYCLSEKTNTQEQNIENICPNCGNICENDSTFCNKCGTKLVSEPPKCPNCGLEYIKNEDIFCKKCGTKLDNIKNLQQQELICPNCFTPYKEGELFCGECGAKLFQEPIKVTMQEEIDVQSKQSAQSKVSSYEDEYNTVKCPYCGSKIKRFVKKCPHCGEWLKGGVSHFGCGSFMMLITTLAGIGLALGGESIGIPFVGEIGGATIFIIAFLYFLPSLISDWRGHDSKLAIFIVNLLFGWTFIGWFAALIFSFTGRSR